MGDTIRLRAKGAAVFLVSAVLAAPDADACGQCIDEAIVDFFPFFPFLAMIYVFWLLAMSVLSVMFRPKPKRSEHPPIEPSKWTVTRFWAYSLITLIVLGMFLAGSVLGPLMAILLGWAIYVLPRLKRFWTTQAPTRREKVYGALYTLTVAACLCAGGYGYYYYNSVKGMVDMLDNSTAVESREIVKQLIERAPESVPLVAAALLRNTANGGAFFTTVERGIYILGKAKLPEGTECLRTLTERARFDRSSFEFWEPAACIAYGQCGRGAAAPVLIAKYRAMDGNRDARSSILTALVATGSREGVLFALDQMDWWIKAAPDGRFREAIPIDSLLFEGDPERLANLPLLDFWTQGTRHIRSSADDERVRRELYWDVVKRSPLEDEKLTAAWNSQKDAIRARWEAAFAGAKAPAA